MTVMIDEPAHPVFYAGVGDVIKCGVGKIQVERQFFRHAARDVAARTLKMFDEQRRLVGWKLSQVSKQLIESVEIFSNLRFIHGLTCVLKILDGALVLLGLCARVKCPEIFALTGGIFLFGVEPVFSAFEFANHTDGKARSLPNSEMR
jgi:hypothetical protein